MPQTKPILLFNDECAVCRRVGHWVQSSAKRWGEPTLVAQPIGDDPVALRLLAPDLDIWDAYETLHLLMPDGSMRLDGEAVAEVLRRLPNTRWFAWTFALSIFGFRPFQMILNLCFALLSDARPLFGCESCGTPSRWVRPFAAMQRWAKAIFGKRPSPSSGSSRHSTPIAVLKPRVRSSARGQTAA